MAAGSVHLLKPGSVPSLVLQALSDIGPLMAVDIVDYIQDIVPSVTRSHVATAIVTLRYRKSGKMVYVKKWLRCEEGTSRRLYPRPVYALGDKPDAPKPRPLSDSEYQRRYKAKRARGAYSRTPNSVFDLVRVGT